MPRSVPAALRDILIILGVLFLASCGASDQPLEPEDSEDEEVVIETGPFRVLTYNIQIAAFGNDFRTNRLPLIKESIKKQRPQLHRLPGGLCSERQQPTI
jgi:hypothetical protein